MISVNDVLIHLLQSTLVAAVAALLALALRKNQARWRFELWLAASVKFLIPFAALAGLGARLGWRPARVSAAQLSFFGEFRQIRLSNIHPAASTFDWTAIWMAAWLAGAAMVLVRWWLSWRRVRALVRSAAPMDDRRELRVLRRLTGEHVQMRESAGRMEPGVCGVFQPVLLWPLGISEHLDDAQLDAILAHEGAHIRRRDNLAAAVHAMVEALFWFHPLVWWLGARMIDERERACDEEVLRMGGDAEAYAQSILKTCRFYLESSQVCMAGVTGSDLKRRVERIMVRRVGSALDLRRKLLLAGAGIAAVAGPVLFGIMSAPVIRAQQPQPSSPDAAPAFEVASVKPSKADGDRMMFRMAPGGRLEVSNMSPQTLIMMAYDLKPGQLSGGPNWIDSVKYDVSAKAEGDADPDKLKLMMRALLADRFKLTIHRETKEMAIYNLSVAKGGFKLKPAAESAGPANHQFRIGRGEITLASASMAQFADGLSRVTGRNVHDQTGIAGTYDFKLDWTPDENENPTMKGPPGSGDSAPAGDATGPSLTSALQEQMGLKLESGKGPVEVVVIDRIEKASEN